MSQGDIMNTFNQFGLSEETLEAVRLKGFEEPTPIQHKVIPALLKGGRDIIGQAQTGTGKTAAFALPLIEKLNEESEHVRALILAPTRELALQISDEINSLKGRKKLDIIPVYGGQSIDVQLRRLKKGVDIVVGTPGRIMDHLRRKTLKLQHLDYLILDEADEMLNMGFIEDIEFIMGHTPQEKRTLLFSATMPAPIRDIAKKYMQNTLTLKVDSENLTTDLTQQIYFEVSEGDKFEALCQMIDIEDDFYGLVFCRTKNDVDTVTSRLIERGYDAEGLHGDITQALRQKIFGRFKKKHISVLVATDVAARGLDVQDLSHVVNYSLPQGPEAYVHRIGRTGRAGKEGTAVTFVTPAEYRKLGFIQKISKAEIKKGQLPKVEDIIERKKNTLFEELDTLIREGEWQDYRGFAMGLLGDHSPEEVVCALLKHAYQDEFDPAKYRQISAPLAKKGKTKLFVAMGKKSGLGKRELISLIEKKSGVKSSEINNLEMYDDYSFISVHFRAAEAILKAFAGDTKRKRPLIEMASGKNKEGQKKAGFKKYYKKKK
ncbi:MAG TPA: DEAD/DEAH box helicase [Firmicutes bacterium]|nr:DEAD/DEAH box helicase [Bacillota bacterium]